MTDATVDEAFKAAMDDPGLLEEFMEAEGADHPLVTDAEEFIRWAREDGEEFVETPVGIRDFIEGSQYLNARGTVYPEVMKDLVRIVDTGPWVEVCMTGGIGSAKTTRALLILAYDLYRLSLYRDPHGAFGLDPTSEITIIFQNINEKLAKTVDYTRFKAMIDRSPYFRKHFDYDRKVVSKMVFKNRIEVVPVVGTDTGALGHNVIGGLIDEVNFMQVVERSVKTARLGDEAYDQASALYNAIARRRESRFMTREAFPGTLCLTSSAQYPGQFTDRKLEEAKDPNSGVYYSHMTVWEAKPDGTYSDETFWVYKGDATHKPRMMGDGEERTESGGMYVEVPVDFRQAFDADIYGALRDIAGVSTYAKHPFIPDTDRVNACFGSHESVLSREVADMIHTRVKIYDKRFTDVHQPRWVHIDLALNNDAAGVSMGYVRRFVEVDRSETVVEMMPEVVFDFTLRIVPPRGGEIIFDKIRALVRSIRDESMIPIRWVSFDGWQSVDMIQSFRANGFKSGLQSLDKDARPYSCFKTALMDIRILSPEHEYARAEIASLEMDTLKKKIDHPPQGSKDVADAMCGVTFGLSTSSFIWNTHGIPPVQVPEAIVEQSKARGSRSADRDKTDVAEPGDVIKDRRFFDYQGDDA